MRAVATLVFAGVAMVALLTNLVADLIALHILRKRHPALWQSLGEPYIPSAIAPVRGYFGRWLNRRGYLDTDDPALIRTCQTANFAFYLVCAASLIFLVLVPSALPRHS
jgi:hypothetical protein